MSVDGRNTVDAIGIEKESSAVVLTVFDHRTWGNNDHLLALQNKLNDYFCFIEDGQLFEAYPDAAGRTIRIDVICRFVPDSSGEYLLSKAQQVAESMGWALSWFVPGNGQPDSPPDCLPATHSGNR